MTLGKIQLNLDLSKNDLMCFCTEQLLKEFRMFIVLTLFEPSGETTEAKAIAVRDVLDRIVAKQPGFIRARLHCGTGHTEGMVANYMEWESEEAFHAFRERHGPEVTEAVGRYNPRFTFFEVAHEVGAWSYKNVA